MNYRDYIYRQYINGKFGNKIYPNLKRNAINHSRIPIPEKKNDSYKLLENSPTEINNIKKINRSTGKMSLYVPKEKSNIQTENIEKKIHSISDEINAKSKKSRESELMDTISKISVKAKQVEDNLDRILDIFKELMSIAENMDSDMEKVKSYLKHN